MKRLIRTFVAAVVVTVAGFAFADVAEARPYACSVWESWTAGHALCFGGKGWHRAVTTCVEPGHPQPYIRYGPWKSKRGQVSTARCYSGDMQQGPTYIRTR